MQINAYQSQGAAAATKQHILDKIAEDSRIGYAGLAEKTDFADDLDYNIGEGEIQRYSVRVTKKILRETYEEIKIPREAEPIVNIFPTNDVFVRDNMRGVSGNSYYADAITLYINADNTEWKDELKGSFAHEYAHAVMHNYYEMNQNTDSLLVFEGVAEQFKERTVDPNSTPWVQVVSRVEAKKNIRGPTRRM